MSSAFPRNTTPGLEPKTPTTRATQILVPGLLIFFLALGIRFLTWQDNHLEVWKVQSYVTSAYKDSAYRLLKGDLRAFVDNINHMGHPPGYPILLAGIFKVFGDSDNAIEFFQMICDAAATVMIFLIALELLTPGVALLAGFLAALSPQFSYYSVLLLPDSLSVVPILLAVYLIVRTRRHPGLLTFATAGALVGLSCWLRANALLLAPFLAVILPLIVARGKRLHAACAIVFGAVVAIAPITIKNVIVYHRFVPLSLGAGQTLLEGLADYDDKGQLNIPATDLGIMRQEAEWYGQPEYALLLFGHDGIQRDRMRVARGLAVIRAHPVWFAGVMVRRAISSTRLDPVPVLFAESPVSHSLDHTIQLQPVWIRAVPDLARSLSVASEHTTITVVDDQWLRVEGDATKYGTQIASEAINVKPAHDYVLHVPLKLEQGRVLVKITTLAQTKVLASMGVDLQEGVSSENQPVNRLAIPFVSANNSQVSFVVANNASVHSVALLGGSELIELGPSSQRWLRYVRMPVRFVQRFFITAWILPLTIVGSFLLARSRKWQTLAILLAVPTYYLLVQSTLHTERRYVYVIHFFFLPLVSVTLCWIFGLVRSGVSRINLGGKFLSIRE